MVGISPSRLKSYLPRTVRRHTSAAAPHEIPTDRLLLPPAGEATSDDRRVGCWQHDRRQTPPASLARPAPVPAVPSG